jgi:integrase/recombinase XerD
MPALTPTITIYVRHSADCKHQGDEFYRRCNCRKWLRWTPVDGERVRIPAKTRSWAEAEQAKRDQEDSMAGRTNVNSPDGTKNIREAIEVFVADKMNEDLSPDLITKYRLHLGRLASYCEGRGVYTVGGIDRELVTHFCSTWKDLYPSGNTRSKLRERYKSFMKFCRDAKWVGEVPQWPKMKVDEVPTLPLTKDEYTRLLDAVFVVVKAPENAVVDNQTYDYWTKRIHALFQLMRFSGLSIQDALTLPRRELIKDAAGHRVVTKRTKTGTPVSVLLRPDVAEELLAVPNDNPAFFFWSGEGSPKSICGNWGKRFIVPAFDAAKIERQGYMLAHRLRDTFACEFLIAGGSMEHLSKLLGHTSIRTTEKHYAAWVEARQAALDAAVVATWQKQPTKKAGKQAA